MPLLVQTKQEKKAEGLVRWLASDLADDQRRAQQVLAGMGREHEIRYLTELAATEELKRQALLDRLSLLRWPLRSSLSVLIALTPFVHDVAATTVCQAVCVAGAVALERMPLPPKPLLRMALLKLADGGDDPTALPVLVEALRRMPAAIRERVVLALIRTLPKMDRADVLTTEQWKLLLRELDRGRLWDRRARRYREKLVLSIIAAIQRSEYFGAEEAVARLVTVPPRQLSSEAIRKAAAACVNHLRRRQHELSRHQGTSTHYAARAAVLRTFRAQLGLGQIP